MAVTRTLEQFLRAAPNSTCLCGNNLSVSELSQSFGIGYFQPFPRVRALQRSRFRVAFMRYHRCDCATRDVREASIPAHQT